MRGSSGGGAWVVLIFFAIKFLIWIVKEATRSQETRTRLTPIRSFRPEQRKTDPGIQFLGPVTAPPAGKGTQCQICGSELRDDLVACGACTTLHHRQCWDYNGGCSTYGCRKAA